MMKNYNGSTLTNAHTINQAREIADVARLRSPLTFKGLSRYLSFISLYALSEHIYFDASIPDGFFQETHSSIEFLGLAKSISPIKPPSDNNILAEETARAVKTAMPLLHKNLDTPLHLQKEIPQGKLENFRLTLSAMISTHQEDNRLSIAMEAHQRDAMGAKFLIGLAHPDNRRLLYLISQRFNRPESLTDLPGIMSNLITIFRCFYLNNWAVNLNSIYATNSDTAKIIFNYKGMVWGQIERELRKLAIDSGIEFPNEVRQDDRLESILPLVGIAALLRSRKGDSPVDLIHRANELASEINLRNLQRKLISYQLGYKGEEYPEAVAQELWERIKKSGGPKTMPEENVWLKAWHQVLPDMATTTAASLVELLTQADLNKLIALLITQTAVKVLWTVVSTYKEHNYVAAISHLIALAEKSSHQSITRKARMIWGENSL